MKIIKILGGLGNQMFQYAFHLALKKNFPEQEVKIDYSCFKGYPLHHGFELDRIFKLNYQIASSIDLLKVAYPYSNYRIWQIGKRVLPKRKSMLIETNFLKYHDEVFTNHKYEYFDGYWQNFHYFTNAKDEIIRAFTFKPLDTKENIELQKQIEHNICVSIHVRRGDYLKHSIYSGICTLEYYQEAIKLLLSKKKIQLFCIFSDDIDWCREYLLPLLINYQVIFVDWNKGQNSYRDMQLMALCNHNIIANSSFSWWGAWLNLHTDKVIIAPQKWINTDNGNMQLPTDWHRI